jgi:hypothetical protein
MRVAYKVEQMASSEVSTWEIKFWERYKNIFEVFIAVVIQIVACRSVAGNDREISKYTRAVAE